MPPPDLYRRRRPRPDMAIKCLVFGAADPGAVPGGSTKTLGRPGALTGPNQDRRVDEHYVFARPD